MPNGNKERDAIRKIVAEELPKILVGSTANIRQGTILELDTKGKRVKVLLQNSSNSSTGWCPYSTGLTDTTVEVGDRCLAVSPDVRQANNFYVIAFFGVH